MELETFFEQFELLADAPNGVQKLRELILQFAVQGKLVPQDPHDEPAEVLLEKIEAEKKRLVKEGKIKKSEKLPSIDVDGEPYNLPRGWKWVRLGETAKVIEYGTSHKSVPTGEEVPVFRMNNIQNGQITFDNLKYVPESIKDLPRLYLENGDLLFNRTNSYELVGKTGIFKGESNKYTFASYLIRISIFYDFVNPEFVNMAMNSGYFRQTQIEPEITQQCGQANFNGTKLKNALIPLPPLPEQHRIVAKVDRLMSLCDELEARQEKRHDRILQLGEVATSQLLTPSTPEAFNQHWQGICNNFDLLYSTPENVSQLRQAILQLAVMGKLVPQDPNDEPASVLLERIREEKARLVKEGKIKKSEKLLPIEASEIPYELPDSWDWVRVDDCYEVAGGIQKTPKRQPVSNYFPYLRVANVYRRRLDLSEIKYFELFEGDLERWRLKAGDLLIVEGNGSEEEIGRCAIWHEEIKDCVHQNHLIMSRPIGHQGSLFTLLFLNSPGGMEEMKRLAITTSGLYSLSVGKIRGIIVPLPPVNEQKRIVAKVDQLMSFCDELEAKLTQSISDREKLMETAVRQVLAA